MYTARNPVGQSRMTAKAKNRPLVFLSYSHLDESWKQLVLEHLGSAITEQVQLWHDEAIEPGDAFHQEIMDRLEEARIAICLISSNFLRSRYCLRREFAQLAERRGRGELELVPIIVDDCLWREIPLVRVHLDVLNRVPVGERRLKDLSPDDARNALSKVAEKISRVAAEPGPGRKHTPASMPDDKEHIFIPPNRFALIGRELETAALEMAWNSDRIRVVSLVGAGGTGKTTLVRAWMNRMKAHGYSGAQRVIAWSFYSQGSHGQAASADPFFDEIFRQLCVKEPPRFSWDKGEQLAQLLRAERTLLFLDGLEPLQAMHEAERGRVLDPGLRVLIEDFARGDQGLCVITTRQPVADLDYENGESVQVELAEVQEEDGADLLAVSRLKGSAEQFRAASRAYDNHPLALRLLAGFLKEFRNRDIQAAGELDPVVKASEIAPPVARVLVNFERHVSPQLIDFLQRVGLFTRPCTLKELEVAGVDPTAVRDLRDMARRLYLLDEEDERFPDRMDVHPLLREYFGQQFRESSVEEWKDAHYRLAGFILSNTTFQPNTLSEMLPLFEAIVHGCRAGVPKKTFSAYYERIERGRAEYQIYQLGAHGLTLSVLAEFFQKPWTQLDANLPVEYRATLLNRAGRCLQALGRNPEAVEPLREALELELAQSDNHENAGIAAENLADSYLEQGNPREGLRYAEQAVDSYQSAVIGADGNQDKIRRVLLLQCGSASTMAVCHWAMGEMDHASTAFDRMLAIHQLANMSLASAPPPVTSTAGFRYGQHLIEIGQWKEAFMQAASVARYAGEFADDHIKGNLLAVEALIAGGQFERAEPFADRAVTTAAAHGDRALLAGALLARGKFRSASGQDDLSRIDLERAVAIAHRAGLKMLEVDTLLACAKDSVATGEVARARREVDRAQAVIGQTGYTRASSLASAILPAT